MAYLWFFGCLINQHKPLRRHVEWDGQTYNGTCKQCGKPITRVGRRNWRLSGKGGAANPSQGADRA